jgi:flavin-dependent dehydrogenase
VDAVVIGGGPAGASVGRLLAAWGHTVVILDSPSPRARGLAESIPPSTRKLLSEIGVLGDVEAARFLRGRGNTVWWASADPRVETFGTGPGALGFQVFRPDFDRVLLESAAAAGAIVRTQARVRSVALGDAEAAVDYEQDGGVSTIAGRLVLDCSGRTGVVSRRFRRVQPGHRTYALVGVWECERWDFPDDPHTAVETFEDGWAWSVPVSSTTRHVGVMVEHGQPYQAAIAKTNALGRRLTGAALQRDWACDASLYFSEPYAGLQFLFVGDAGSFIDPLSSFGVKKALASAWLAAVAAHTSLAHPERRSVAFEFFSNWERRVYDTHLRRSRDFARAAFAEHPSAFWESRAKVEIASSPDDDDELGPGASRFETTSPLNLRYADEVRFEEQPVVRGREIVLERAFAGGMRFAGHVDLVTLAEMACQHRRVPELFDAYCQNCPPVPLPNVVGGLSLLVAKGILHERT